MMPPAMTSPHNLVIEIPSMGKRKYKPQSLYKILHPAGAANIKLYETGNFIWMVVIRSVDFKGVNCWGTKGTQPPY